MEAITLHGLLISRLHLPLVIFWLQFRHPKIGFSCKISISILLWPCYGFIFIRILNLNILWLKILMNYGSLLKSDMNSKRNLFSLRPIMDEITYVSKILNLWQTIIMIFIGFALSWSFVRICQWMPIR